SVTTESSIGKIVVDRDRNDCRGSKTGIGIGIGDFGGTYTGEGIKINLSLDLFDLGETLTVRGVD
ncbi:MAG: hypothetical protein UX41_C0008G0001, partial [Candidatus Collierbacteria bacterium GW2011_GWE1_46_18]